MTSLNLKHLKHFKQLPFLILNILNILNNNTGISPLLTSGLITSFMSSASFLNIENKKTENMSANDKKKREKKIQKFFGIVLCFFQASAYVLSGMYGKVEDLGSGNATMIVLQVPLSFFHTVLFICFVLFVLFVLFYFTLLCFFFFFYCC